MAKEHKLFGPEGITDEDLIAWHNVPHRIRYRDTEHGGPGLEETVLAWDYVETNMGSLVIQRLVQLDPDHPAVFTFRTIAGGAWLDVQREGATWDLDAIKRAEQDQANARAAEELGVAGRNGGRASHPRGIGRS